MSLWTRGWEGAGKLPEGTLPGGTGTAHLRQQAGSLGRREHPVPVGWFPTAFLPSLPQKPVHRVCCYPHQRTTGPVHCPPRQKRWASSALAGLRNLESTKPPACPGLEFRTLMNLKGEPLHLYFHRTLRFSSFFFFLIFYALTVSQFFPLCPSTSIVNPHTIVYVHGSFIYVL